MLLNRIPGLILAACAIACAQPASAQGPCMGIAEPIVDIHIHAYPAARKIPPVPNPRTGVPTTASTGLDHRQLTLANLKRLGVVRAIVSSENLSDSEAMIAADPDRMRLGFLKDDLPTEADLAQLRELHRQGRLAMIGEIAPQYSGIAPNDPRMEPFWALAEELQLPVGYHMGSGPADVVYRGNPHHRAALGKALLMEDVLVRHPKLKLIIMHGGYPFEEETEALLFSYSQVYIDLGAIHSIENRAGFHLFLKRMMEVGFGKRIVFGSDEMIWPETIEQAIQAYKEAPYLSDAQRRDIFFNNAVRLFGWSDLAGCATPPKRS